MSDKIILTIAYSATSALGLWLIIDVAGWIATVAGAGLMFFAGAGVAGMATFGSADRGENYRKSGKALPSFQLASVNFANNFNNFSISLSTVEINKVYSAGQILAPQMKYQTSWNMPRLMPSEIEFPFCAVGEFVAIWSILEDRRDAANKELLADAMVAFENKFEDEIENLRLHLSL